MIVKETYGTGSCSIDVICKYHGLKRIPDSCTAKCYSCENNQISKFKDLPIEILLLHAVFGGIPEEALKLNKEV